MLVNIDKDEMPENQIEDINGIACGKGAMNFIAKRMETKPRNVMTTIDSWLSWIMVGNDINMQTNLFTIR